LLPQAVAFLAQDWSGKAPLDLARWLVVVPTRQAGRRLREALAEYAAVRGQAVFPPRVVTPELLVTQSAAAGVATRLESLVAWTEALRKANLDDFRSVFPIDPPTRDFAWSLRLAKEFIRLQSTLGEGGLFLADVVGKAGDDLPEIERWRQLGQLESLHAEQLGVCGLRDPQAARIAGAKQPPALRDFDRIAVLGTPDPLPLALSLLDVYAATVPVDVVIYAPLTEAHAFDGWGRPRADGWERRVLVLPAFEKRVHLCADPAEQARRITAIAQKLAAPAETLSIGIADAELLPLLENALARAGIAAFNPEGHPRRHDRLYALLAALADFTAEPTFEAVSALLRCPDVLAWLAGLAGGRFSPSGMLVELDQLRSAHLPPTLAAARVHVFGFPIIAQALIELERLRATLLSGKFPANASAALGEIFSQRELDAMEPLAESAEVWMAGLREIGKVLSVDGAAELTLTEAWQFALGAFGDEVRTAERPEGAVDLLGWLELLWDDAPYLLVAGFNDGRVPSAVVGDAFLPEALREKLGLKRNAERFACDAYFLAALAAARDGDSGRIEVLLGKTSASGDPLRPSRLLLRCADEELPARVKHLFGPVDAAKPNPAWSRAWTLKPRVVATPKRLSVTALRDWLACPFRFYLKHALKLTRVDLDKAELDARDFGTLLHAALQQLGENVALRDCADPARLREFLMEQFERAVWRRYGTELTLPLVVQFESARQRLRAAADLEAAERADGWRTERVEWKFEFPLGDLTVSGKIDRIDRHADGRVRVLDYKTGDKAAGPVAAHLRSVRADELERPDWLRYVEGEGKPRAWADLQLPLYRRAVAVEFGDAVACGYFNLPKAAGETAVTMWDDFTRDTQAAAERCAEGVIAAVVAGEFWPPRELSRRDSERDEFAEFFHHGAATSIAWEDKK
jgi:ATP-dependent helicase/nuclease subunit B